MSKIISAKTVSIINAIAILIAGVLFCCSNALGTKWLSVILGVSVMLLGLITLVSELLKEKTLVSKSVVIGSAITALGIFIIVRDIAGTVLGLIPYVFIVVGACVFADAFLLYFWRKNRNVALFVLELLVGAALIVLGALFIGVASFRRFMGILFGIALIVYAIVILINSLKASSRAKKSKS